MWQGRIQSDRGSTGQECGQNRESNCMDYGTGSQNLAEERTHWAEDRTILANERTYSGWLRTGFAAIAVGLGFQAVFGEAESVWLAKVGATVFVLMGPIVVALACSSAGKVLDRLNSHAAEPSSRKRMKVLTALSCIGSLILLVVLWTL